MHIAIDLSTIHDPAALNRIADQCRAEANRLIAESRQTDDLAKRDRLFWAGMAIGDRANEAAIAAVGF